MIELLVCIVAILATLATLAVLLVALSIFKSIGHDLRPSADLLENAERTSPNVKSTEEIYLDRLEKELRAKRK